MGSKFQSFQRSPHGVFVRSPNGVRNSRGDLVIGGDFVNSDGNIAFKTCILRSGELVPIFEDEDPRIDQQINKVLVYKKDLYIGGLTNSGISVLNKETEKFDIVGGGIVPAGEIVLDMVVFNDRLIIVGGFNSANGVVGTKRIAAWNGTIFQTMFSPETGSTQIFLGDIAGVEVHGGQLYVTGAYNLFDGLGSKVPIDGKWMAVFNGSGWDPAGVENKRGLKFASFNGDLHTIVAANIHTLSGASTPLTGGNGINLRTIGNALYAVGSFTDVDGVAVQGVAKFTIKDGWEAVGDGFNSSFVVHDVIEHKKEIYITGLFQITFETINRQGFAKLDKENNIWIAGSTGVGFLGGTASGRSMEIVPGL